MMYVHSRRNYTRKSTWEFTLIFYNQTHKNIHLNINTYYTHTHTHTDTHTHTYTHTHTHTRNAHGPSRDFVPYEINART